MNKNTKITIAISASVIIIFFLSLSIFGKQKNVVPNDTNLNATSTFDVASSSTKETYILNVKKSSKIDANVTSGLSVKDQLADDYVSFYDVNFEDDTWVAVYEDKNGEPSNLIGTGLFFGGTAEGVSPLVRPTIAGSKYYVTLIKDNGDRVFNLLEDRPSLDAPIVSFIAK